MSPRSLRFKLAVAVAAVVVAAVIAVGLGARQATLSNFDTFLAKQSAASELPDLPSLVDPVVEAHAQGGWPAVDDALAGWREQNAPEHDLLILDANDRLLASSAPELAEWTFETLIDGEIRATRHGPSGTEAMIRLRVPSTSIERADGSFLGELTLFDLPRAEVPDDETVFVTAVSRRLLVTVLVAGLAAIVLTWLTTRRLMAPIEELTQATRLLEAGDLSKRVSVNTRDELGQLAQAFNSMARALESNEIALRNMVNDTAHELRTPITNLRCQIEALQDGLMSIDDDALGSLHEEVVVLQKLAEDLQVLALADAGELRLDLDSCVLEQEVARAVRSTLGARVAGETRITSALADLPDVQADPVRLQQILINILSNALDHTPAGGRIRITGTLAEHMVEVAVKDDGRGIAAEHLPRLFERFYRTDPSRQRATGRAGLGLAIVKRLVEAQGGRVSVTSREGAGTRVAFTLPVASSVRRG